MTHGGTITDRKQPKSRRKTYTSTSWLTVNPTRPALWLNLDLALRNNRLTASVLATLTEDVKRLTSIYFSYFSNKTESRTWLG